MPYEGVDIGIPSCVYIRRKFGLLRVDSYGYGDILKLCGISCCINFESLFCGNDSFGTFKFNTVYPCLAVCVNVTRNVVNSDRKPVLIESISVYGVGKGVGGVSSYIVCVCVCES